MFRGKWFTDQSHRRDCTGAFCLRPHDRVDEKKLALEAVNRGKPMPKRRVLMSVVPKSRGHEPSQFGIPESEFTIFRENQVGVVDTEGTVIISLFSNNIREQPKSRNLNCRDRLLLCTTTFGLF